MRWQPLVTCEHASGDVPRDLDLGLEAAILESHVSYDRGARAVAVVLSAELGAPLHLGRYSRLVVDLNRRDDNPDVIVASTYGIAVPANAALDAAGRAARIARFHRPYRDAARADAMRLAAAGGCLHLSIHSFDPALDPPARAFDAGVLFDTAREPESTLARELASELSRGLDVRLNEPYAGTPEGLTSWLREQIAPDRYVGIEIEASYAWMDAPGALEGFAATLADAVGPLLA